MDKILKDLLLLFKAIVDDYNDYQVKTQKLSKIFEETDPQAAVENKSGKSMPLVYSFLANLGQNVSPSNQERKKIIDFFSAQLNADKPLYDNVKLLYESSMEQDEAKIKYRKFLLDKKIAINLLNYDGKKIFNKEINSLNHKRIYDKYEVRYSDIFQKFKELDKFARSQIIKSDTCKSNKHTITINNETDISLLRFCSFFESLEKKRLTCEVNINIEDPSKIADIIEDVQKISGENRLKISIDNNNISKDDVSNIFNKIEEGAKITYINFKEEFKVSETKSHLEDKNRKVPFPVYLKGNELPKDRESIDPDTILEANKYESLERGGSPQPQP